MPDWTLPTLTTERLVLRPLLVSDGPRVCELAGDPEIARNTLGIPHPYPEGAAEEWIGSLADQWRQGAEAVFAVVLRESGLLVGCVGLSAMSDRHRRADAGWWIGREYWNRGYCTEAARGLLGFAFGPLGLNRVYSSHYAHNPASGRVMQKLGMTREGCQRRHVERWGEFHDLVLYGILREEWQAAGNRLDQPGV